MKNVVYMAVLSLLLPLPAAELPELLARFGTVELKKERFQRYNIPEDPSERRAALKKMVDTEVYLIIVRQLLSRSGISPDPLTARRYVEMRRKQFPDKSSSPFLAALEKNISKPEFQLKCALYFTFYAADPATVEAPAKDVLRHYELNREQFRLPRQSELALFRAGKNTPEGRQQAKLILSRLRQGEDFYALAKQYDPEGRASDAKPHPELQPYFKGVEKLAPGESTAVETPELIFIVKLIARDKELFRSFAETKLYITEMLSSALLKKSLEQYMYEILAKTPVQYFF